MIRLEWQYRIVEHGDRLEFVDFERQVREVVNKRGEMKFPEMWNQEAELCLDSPEFLPDNLPEWVQLHELVKRIQQHSSLLFAVGYTAAEALGDFEQPMMPQVVKDGPYLVGEGVDQLQGLDGSVIQVEPGRVDDQGDRGWAVAAITSGDQTFEVELTEELIPSFVMSTQPLVI